jgi:NAD(P)-dependent dehydrogenase (short-subunit alcohol dehydrogenase family)
MTTARRFESKVAVITGGGSGIGQACAVRFANEGAHVVVADIRVENGLGTLKQIEKTGGSASFIQTDVTSGTQVESLIIQTVKKYDRLDILVPAAGIGAGGTVIEITEDQWDRLIDLDLKSVFLSCKYALPAIKSSGGGAVVTIGSLSSVIGNGAAHFSAAKGGVLNLSRSMSVAHAADKIRVNCVCPGYIKTPILGALLNNQDWLDQAAGSAPMGRMGRADEVAAAICFLASDDASFITGAVLNVDGGYLAQGKF